MIDLLLHTDPRYAAVRARSRRARNDAFRAVARALFRLPGRELRAVATRWRRRRLVAELRALDDMILADIGIFRGEIWPTVDELLRRQHADSRVAEASAGNGARPRAPAWFGRPHRLARPPAAAQNDNRTAAGLTPAATPTGRQSA